MLRPLAVCLCLLLAGACAADDPIPSSDSGADPTAITSTVLLDAVDQSILGSILEYPDSGQAGEQRRLSPAKSHRRAPSGLNPLVPRTK